MPESWGYPLLMVALVVFLGWFLVGTQWNVRKGDSVLKWLRQGLPLVGERTTMRWMGSTALELKVGKASDPFRTAETVIVFEPRDVPFVWAWARLRRRCDTLIFRAQLRSMPSFEMEVFDPKGWTNGGIEGKVQNKEWHPMEISMPSSFRAYAAGPVDPAVAKRVVDMASHAGGELMRLSVHRNVPNLEVHWRLPDPGTCSARDLYMKLRQISQDVIKP